MRKFLWCFFFIFGCVSAFGQKAEVSKGNRQFKKGEYAKADINYRKALMKDSTMIAATYNLANNLYRQENYDEAAKLLAAKDNDDIASVPFSAQYYFNTGDVACARQDWETAVNAFKDCLRLTPDDIQAKENYIYARNKLMEQQQNQDQNQDQDQDQQQDQNQDQNQDQQQDQNQNQDQQDQGDQQQQQQQPQPDQLSPQQAQQLLQAIREKEKQTQEKVDEKKAQALKSRQKEKNW